MPAERRVLVVDDEPDLLDALEEALAERGYVVTRAAGVAEARGRLDARAFDVALVDIMLPDGSGLDLFRALHEHDPTVPVIIMTGNPTFDTALQALKLGVYDYLVKPLHLADLQHLVSRAAEHRTLRQEREALRPRLGARLGVSELVGASPAMARVREMMAQVAVTDVPVLIEGESGTGKELIAAGIHRLSRRRERPLISVNCAAIPVELAESEFFGHRRGAFTGAVADTPGLFRSADRGTLFLDEVTEVPPPVQAKLLRVLQDGVVRPVGAAATRTVDVRVITATNRLVEQAMRDGVLREDLFYRLGVVRIQVPPLRERKEDVPELVAHFVGRLNARFGAVVERVAPDALALLVGYDFPGNVRELENLLERAYALGARRTIRRADLPLPQAGPSPAGLPTVATMERELILRALELHGHDKKRAARAIGLSRRTLYRRLKEYGLL